MLSLLEKVTEHIGDTFCIQQSFYLLNTVKTTKNNILLCDVVVELVVASHWNHAAVCYSQWVKHLGSCTDPNLQQTEENKDQIYMFLFDFALLYFVFFLCVHGVIFQNKNTEIKQHLIIALNGDTPSQICSKCLILQKKGKKGWFRKIWL